MTMAGAIEKVGARLLAWNADAWNHRLRMVIATPVLLFAGGIASIYLQVLLAHRGYVVGPDGVFTLVTMVVVSLAGYVVLALLD